MLALTVMMYHYVRDAGDTADAGSGIPGLPVQEFCAQLDQLARDYEMVNWDDVRTALLEQKALPAQACLLTFDDGVCDHFLNVLPELRRRNISGLFFAMARQDVDGVPLPHKIHYLLAQLGLAQLRQEILTRLDDAQRETFFTAAEVYRARGHNVTDAFKGPLQRELEQVVAPILTELLEAHVGPEPELGRKLFLSAEQVREMRAGGMHFGGHSRTHPWFDFIDAARRDQEIRASCEWLGGIEQAPYAFAYPYGGLAEDAPHLLQLNNFRAAFTTRSQIGHPDPYYIGRFDGDAIQEWPVDNGSG